VPEATLTSKGQVTIPLEVRERLGLRAGSRVSFVLTADGAFELIPATGTVRDLRGALAAAASARPVSVEAMDDAVAAGALERTRR
jgi:AbrB family looped-hinge helix DNA binding protein